MTLQEELRKRIPILSRADAAEVERCMEWARRECAEAELDMDTMNEHPCGCCAYVEKHPRSPLTLPPDGWQP